MEREQQPQNNLQNDEYIALLPKRSQITPLRVQSLTNTKDFRTNFYDIELTAKSLFLYQYTIETNPEIPLDSTKVWYKLIKNTQKKLEKQIGLIAFRGNTLWGNKNFEGQSLDMIWISKYKVRCQDSMIETSSLTTSQIPSEISSMNLFEKQTQSRHQRTYKDQETKYMVSIRKTNKLDLKSLINDQEQRGKFIQIMNIKIKDKLESLGFIELGKGRFYQKSTFDQNKIQEVGLQILRGYKFTFSFLRGNKLCLQVDPCTRILQSQTLAQIIRAMGRKKAERLLKNATVITRYGNYSTYKIGQIDFFRNPKSFFYKGQNKKSRKPGQKFKRIKQNYVDYYMQRYGISIRDMKQPLVKIFEKSEKKVIRGKIQQRSKFIYLIPELLSLTGMTEEQRRNTQAMKAITPFTKLPPKTRIIESQKVIHQLQAAQKKIQKSSKEDFSMIKISKPTIIKGFQLNPVSIEMSESFQVQNGQFNIRQPLLNPAKFNDWLIFFSNATLPDKIKQFIKLLKKSSKNLAIQMKQPSIFGVSYTEEDKKFQNQKIKWEEAIHSQLDKCQEESQFPQIIVFYLQSFQQFLYGHLKRILINHYGVVSQAVKAENFQRQSNSLSIATGIIVQMNQKIGKTVWKISNKLKQFHKNNYESFQIVKRQKNHHDNSKLGKSREEKKKKKEKKKHHQQQKISQVQVENKPKIEQVLGLLDESKISENSSFAVVQCTVPIESQHHKEKSFQNVKKQPKQKKVKKEHKQKKEKKEKKARKEEQISETFSIGDSSIIESIPVHLIQEQKSSQSKFELSNTQFRLKEQNLQKILDQSLNSKSRKHEKDKKEKKQKKEKKSKKQKHQHQHKKQIPNKENGSDHNSISIGEKQIRKMQREMKKAEMESKKFSQKVQTGQITEIACAGFSSSMNPASQKFTISFVGTTNKEQTQVFTHCRTSLRRRDFLADQEYRMIFNHWLKTYYEKSRKQIEGEIQHCLPSILIIYREGVAEGQLRKQIFREIRALKRVIAQNVPKQLTYNPEIIYLTVNKRSSTRFYDNETKQPRNAPSGSVIFDEFAKNNTMDFHLVAQHVESQAGASAPVQYRIVYRNKFNLSEAALAQFTFQQCFNYYNWAGSVRIPSSLQCASKLSKLVGQNVKQNICKINKKKALEQKCLNTQKITSQYSMIRKSQSSQKHHESFTSSIDFASIGNNNVFANFLKSQGIEGLSKELTLSGIDQTMRFGLVSKNQSRNNKKGSKQTLKDKKSLEKCTISKPKILKQNKHPREKIIRPERKKEIVDTFFFL